MSILSPSPPPHEHNPRGSSHIRPKQVIFSERNSIVEPADFWFFEFRVVYVVHALRSNCTFSLQRRRRHVSLPKPILVLEREGGGGRTVVSPHPICIQTILRVHDVNLRCFSGAR